MTQRQDLKKFRQTLSSEENLILEYQLRAMRYIVPFLDNQFRLEEEVAHLVKMKEGGNPAFAYDVAVNNLIHEVIKEYGFKGELYAEESQWSSFGSDKEVLITDPICNSSFLRRGFRNVGSGITFFKDERFVAGALTDFGSRTICLSNQERVIRLLLVDKSSVLIQPARVSGEKSIEKAFVAFSLYGQEHRKRALEESDILKKLPLLVEVLGGQPNWARLTQGYIDGFINPFRGMAIYEAASGEIARRAGAVFRDMDGRDIQMGSYIKELKSGSNTRVKFIAAASEELYQKIRELL